MPRQAKEADRHFRRSTANRSRRSSTTRSTSSCTSSCSTTRSSTRVPGGDIDLLLNRRAVIGAFRGAWWTRIVHLPHPRVCGRRRARQADGEEGQAKLTRFGDIAAWTTLPCTRRHARCERRGGGAHALAVPAPQRCPIAPAPPRFATLRSVISRPTPTAAITSPILSRRAVHRRDAADVPADVLPAVAGLGGGNLAVARSRYSTRRRLLSPGVRARHVARSAGRDRGRSASALHSAHAAAPRPRVLAFGGTHRSLTLALVLSLFALNQLVLGTASLGGSTSLPRPRRWRGAAASSLAQRARRRHLDRGRPGAHLDARNVHVPARLCAGAARRVRAPARLAAVPTALRRVAPSRSWRAGRSAPSCASSTPSSGASAASSCRMFRGRLVPGDDAGRLLHRLRARALPRRRHRVGTFTLLLVTVQIVSARCAALSPTGSATSGARSGHCRPRGASAWR